MITTDKKQQEENKRQLRDEILTGLKDELTRLLADDKWEKYLYYRDELQIEVTRQAGWATALDGKQRVEWKWEVKRRDPDCDLSWVEYGEEANKEIRGLARELGNYYLQFAESDERAGEARLFFSKAKDGSIRSYLLGFRFRMDSGRDDEFRVASFVNSLSDKKTVREIKEALLAIGNGELELVSERMDGMVKRYLWEVFWIPVDEPEKVSVEYVVADTDAQAKLVTIIRRGITEQELPKFAMMVRGIWELPEVKKMEE